MVDLGNHIPKIALSGWFCIYANLAPIKWWQIYAHKLDEPIMTWSRYNKYRNKKLTEFKIILRKKLNERDFHRKGKFMAIFGPKWRVFLAY